MKWMKSARGRKWHILDHTEHYRDEYKNGTVVEGDLAHTACKVSWHLKDVTIVETDYTEPACPRCEDTMLTAIEQ